jgi:uncharacterized repeat protein (TIGR01451 family)
VALFNLLNLLFDMTKNTLLLVFCLVLGFMPLVSGQNIAPVIEWQQCFGSQTLDDLHALIATPDGGYIFVAPGGELGISNSIDILVVKLSASRTIEWQKVFGGSDIDGPAYIAHTKDGGYIIAASTYSRDGDMSGNHGSTDVWVAKLTSNGIVQWKKCLGGSNLEACNAVIQTADGGYAIAAGTYSNDGDVVGHHGNQDGWLIKLSATGVLEWQKSLGGRDRDETRSIIQTKEGGYIVAGLTQSNDGDVSGNRGSQDAWVIKLSSSGNIQWQKCLGGSNSDGASAIIQTADGGYAIAGVAASSDGDVTRNDTRQEENGWGVKLSAVGNIEWQKSVGGTRPDIFRMIVQTPEGGYLLGGHTSSFDGILPVRYDEDYWLVKFSNQGVLQWQKTLGGSYSDFAKSLILTKEGDYIIAGDAASNDGDVVGNHGSRDIWMVKLSSDAKAIMGQVQQANSFCQNLTPPQYVANTQVKIEKNNATYYVSADSLGRFGIFADTGRFTVTALSPNNLWTTCPPQTLTIGNPNRRDTTVVNPNLSVNLICPQMEVQLTTPFLRRCFESTYTINYANRGTAIQNDATAELTLDSMLTYISATRPVRSRVGNKIVFSLGNIGINQVGQFTVNVLVSCNSTSAQTHCSSVLIPKTMTCDTVQDSIPSIVNQCVAGCDSVAFLVSKPNTTLNKTFKYQLIADATAVDTGRFVLTNTFNLKRKMDGRTYRLEIRNPVTNQLLVARSVESPPTVTTPSVSTGFVNQFAQSIKQTNIAENCTMNRGSFDPNDKAATPTGIGTRRFIEQGNTIEYLVRFQNTGTDTAFKVVVKDTLAAHFDLSSFKLNATSHTATWQLNPKGVLVVTFNNINLVDSFTNEKGSHGFFKYSIKLKDSILTNTLVTNKAAIYFDFNEPIITNLTSHTIGKEGLKSCLAKPAVSVSYSGCPSKNIVFNATSTSAGANPTYSWYRNNETTPLSTTNRLTLTNASNGTKIYCKLNASDDICTETPVVTSDTIVLNCIGVPTNELSIIQTFDVFPNPNKGVFTVKLNVAKPTKMQLSILNYLGQTIKSETITADNYAETFDLSAVPNGIYLVKLTIEGRSVVKKVSVQ